ncbi:unnamed protein product [Didymodactylos carnosus]|uniref:Uncharacterized protein n=1 Tax=Didymodactylos carnosus TaxID=1234261 RepID=A0A814HVU6_9BILA|nr:unnamed protein product [Didymodactylos carnosus]CAF1014624.1 unnamed protein product [Didymodactylos carnosus]CAF3630432.1 unnamed protein product [Didymodactylos carnosus]CAF3786128.1 unnamed protein product [Didymodactylos carnosus]
MTVSHLGKPSKVASVKICGDIMDTIKTSFDKVKDKIIQQTAIREYQKSRDLLGTDEHRMKHAAKAQQNVMKLEKHAIKEAHKQHHT